MSTAEAQVRITGSSHRSMPEAVVRTVGLDGLIAPSEKSVEDTLFYLETLASSRKIVVPEGPPIYLYGTGNLSVHATPFGVGWYLANELTKQVGAKAQHYILIDDVHYRPESANKNGERRLRDLMASSEPMQQSPLHPGTREQPSVRVFWQSSLASQLQASECSVVDAAVNAQKITDQLFGRVDNKTILPENIGEDILLPVIHPSGEHVKAQQARMLEVVYRRLRKDPRFHRRSDGGIRSLITDMYRHVWINQTGRIQEVTFPFSLGERWTHQRVHF